VAFGSWRSSADTFCFHHTTLFVIHCSRIDLVSCRNLLIKATAKLAQSSVVSARLELQFDLATDLPPVLRDSTQILQLIMNLVISAAETISPHSGAVLVRTCLVDVTPETRQAAILIDPNISAKCIAIVVEDTGCGISKSLKRIFEPLFTTKLTGRGLGLSTVLGIVRGHHGALTVKSDEGHPCPAFPAWRCLRRSDRYIPRNGYSS